MIIFYGEVYGVPLDWIIFGTIGVFAFITILILVFMRGGDKSPVEEDLAMIVPEDEFGTLQEGILVGNCKRREDELLVTVPEWMDEDEEGPYTAELDLKSEPGGKKVPLPFRDVLSSATKRLWVVLDKGDLTVVSFSTLLHGLPKRWDPPYSDRRKAGKFLVGRYGGGTLTSMLTSKLGLMVVFGVLMSGALFGFFLTVASGHFH